MAAPTMLLLFLFFSPLASSSDLHASSLPSNGVVDITSMDQFKEEIQNAQDSNKTVAIEFMATWCQPCRSMDLIFWALSMQYSDKVVFLRVDIESQRDIADLYGVYDVPTYIFLENGAKVGEMVGAANPSKLKVMFRNIVSGSASI